MRDSRPTRVGGDEESRMSLRRAAFEVKSRTVLRSSRKMMDALLRNDTLAPEALDRLGRERVMAQARFAMAHTRFYADHYRDAGLSAADLWDLDALESLPLVEKSHIREQAESFRSDEWTPRRAVRITTGGSTGRPLTLERDRRVPARGFEWRLQNWWGVRPEDDTAIVYRIFRSRRDMALQSVLWWPSARFHCDALQMTEEAIFDFLSEFRRRRPRFLIGYVGGIVELARFVAARGIELPAPRAIAVTAAPMTEQQRRLVESALGAPTYDHYRCAEFNWMAGECRAQDGLHTFSDIKWLEVIGSDGRPSPAGQVGQTVLTDPLNRVFPLIRYRLGDRTARIDAPCSCGSPFPRIEPIHGRVSDALRLNDGRVLPGEALTQLFKAAIDHVEQFQIHQRADGSITVRCIAGRGPEARQAIERVVSQFRGIVGATTDVRLEIVDDIAHDGGKIRYITSDLAAA